MLKKDQVPDLSTNRRGGWPADEEACGQLAVAWDVTRQARFPLPTSEKLLRNYTLLLCRLFLQRKDMSGK